MNRFNKKAKRLEPEKSAPARPMREFNHGYLGEEPDSRGRFTLIFRALLLFLLILLAVAGVVLSLDSNEEDEAPVEQVARLDFKKNQGGIDIPQLIDGYIDATGGREALSQIRSVRYEGRLFSSSGEYHFLGLLLLPDKGMLVTSSDGGGSVKLMLNGDVAWQVIDPQEGPRRVVSLGDRTKESLQWSLRVHNSFRSLAMQGRYSDLTAREIDYTGKPCYELTELRADGTKLKAVVDKETLYLLETQETLSAGEDADEFTVIYEDHQNVAGIIEPYKTKLYRNGELDNEAVVSSYRINPGLVSSLFEIPEELGD